MKNSRWMLLALIIIATVALPITADAAKVKLNKKEASLTIGGTIQLTVKGTRKSVKWSSSNKKVATVSRNGKVKGKKIGKAVITARIEKKKLKCRIIVKKKKNSTGNKPQFSTKHIKLNLHSRPSDSVKITNMSSTQMKKVKVWMADEDKEEIGKEEIIFTVSGNTITLNAKIPGAFYLYASYGRKRYGKETVCCRVTIDGADYYDVIYDGVVYEQGSISQAQYGNLLCKAYPESYGVFRNRYLSRCKTELAKILCINKFYLDNNYRYSTTDRGGTHYFNTCRIGNCMDYSNETYNLCCIAGIPVETVFSSELNHMWNQVYLGGAWCPLETTGNELHFYPLGYKTSIPNATMVSRGVDETGNRVVSREGFKLVVNSLIIDLSKCLISFNQNDMTLGIFPQLELKEQLKDSLKHGKYVNYDFKNDFVDGRLP